MRYIVLLLLLSTLFRVQAWTHYSTIKRHPTKSRRSMTARTPPCTGASAKESFLSSLDYLDRLNEHNLDRTRLLQDLIDNKAEVPIQVYTSGNERNESSIQNPGLWDSMQPVATGTWKVIYAPHMTTMAALAGKGTLDVSYMFERNGTMRSHAVCDFSWLPSTVILSVSGTFGSVSSEVCRVDFDRAWVTLDRKEPYPTFEDVPQDVWKEVISALGRLFFIEQVSVFPISYLDDNLIVFDFELLGTRICARKID